MSEKLRYVTKKGPDGKRVWLEYVRMAGHTCEKAIWTDNKREAGKWDRRTIDAVRELVEKNRRALR